MTTPSALHPEAVGERIDALGANGHAWMDGPTMLSLATAPTSDQQMLTQASALTSAAQTVPHVVPSVSHNLTDQIPYSPSDQAVQTIHSIVGAPQFSPDDLTGIQSQLANMGYAKNLSSNGVWSSDWQQAYSTFANDVRSRAFQGEGGLGTVRTKSALHSFLSAITPSHALSAAIGFVTSIPHDLRQLVGDTVGATEGLGSYIGREAVGITGKDWSTQGQKSIFGSAEHDALTGSGFIEGKTAEEQHAEFTDANGNWSWGRVAGRTIDNLGSALLVVPGLGELGDAALKIGSKGLVADLVARNAVERSPGLIARTLIGDGKVQLGLLNREAVKNIPILGRVGPALFKAEPGYYRMRTLLASPYQFGAVQMAGTAFQKAVLLGAASTGVAALGTAVGGDPNSGLAEAVRKQWINPADVRLGFLKPFGLDNAIDDLGFVLHGPLGAPIGSSAVGKSVDEALAAHTKIMGGPLSPLGAIQHAEALSRKTNTLISPKVKSLEQWHEQFGGETNFNEWAQAKTTQHAAAMQAEHEWDIARQNGDPVPDSLTSVEGQKWIRDRSDDIIVDDNRRLDAWVHLAADPAQFSARLHREMVNSQMDLEHATGNGGQEWVETNRALRGVNADPKLRAELLTPESWKAEQAQRDLVEAQKIGPAAGGPVSDPVLDKQWAHQQMLNQSRGRIGLARKDSWVSQDVDRWKTSAQAQWQDFLDRASHIDPADKEALANLEAEQNTFINKAIVELGTNGNRNVSVLSDLLHTATGQNAFDGLMKVADDVKSMLSAEVYHVADASPAVRAAFAKADAAGYKIVYGKGVGHFAEVPFDPQELGDALTKRRRIFSALGLSDVRASNATASTHAYVGIKQNLQRLQDTKQIEVPSQLWSPDVIIGLLRHATEENGVAAGLSAGERGALGISTPLQRRQALAVLEAKGQTREVERRIGKGTRTTANPEDLTAAYHAMEQQMINNLGMRDLRRKEIVDILTNPERIPWLAGQEHLGLTREDGSSIAALSVADAHKVADAVAQGFAYRPGYLTGAQHMEDIFRGGMGLLGAKWVSKMPGPLEHSVTGLARMPNAYYRTMTRLRFRLSPFFDVRRVAKTNLKFGAAGIRPAADPAHALLAEGGPEAYNNAHALLDKVWPDVKHNPYGDASDQILAANGVWGLYNPRHFAAWAVHDMALQGKSIREMRATLDKTMTYGDRTAIERTANTVFFPFSFDKTLYRSVGGYVLDHPAQALIMMRAFQAYDQFSQDHPNSLESYVWWQEHAPILNEVNRLNAFAHGIGPGELGGINAPLLNAFLPQSLPATLRGQTAIKRLIPALSDINRIGSELQQTGRSAWLASQEGLYRAQIVLGQRKETPLNAPASSVSGKYALDDALKFKASLSDALKQVLDYNLKHPNARYRWPDTDQVPANVRNQPIDATTVGLIVQHRFPTFNPAKGAEIAIQSKQKFISYLGQHADDPNYAAALEDFAKQVNSLSSHIHAEDRDPAALASASAALRSFALNLTKTHPDFASAYTTFFSHTLGPIEVKP